jgi:peroxiredoxin
MGALMTEKDTLTEIEQHDINEPQPTAAEAEPATTPAQPARGVSPAVVMLFITGLMGLVVAVGMLLAEGGRSGAGGLDPGSPAQVVGGGGGGAPLGAGSRSMREWEADDFELPTLDGGTLRLTDYSGRPVFLNFWRTDCAPCVRELPAFQTFIQQQGDEGAIVLAVNQGESADDIREFLDEIGIDSIPVLLDPTLSLTALYPANALPTTYFINANGMVEYLRLGEMTIDEMYEYLEDPEDAIPQG